MNKLLFAGFEKGKGIMMQFTLQKEAWTTIEEGEKNCYLMVNGLGGYNSQSVIGAMARGDQAFFMAAKKAPNVRWHMLTNLLEKVTIDGQEYILTSQRMEQENDLEGFRYLEEFSYGTYPTWRFQVGEVEVVKTIVMKHGENTIAVNYEIENKTDKVVTLEVSPLIRMTAKNTPYDTATTQNMVSESINDTLYAITNQEDTIYFTTNGIVTSIEPLSFGPMYFSQDERDGRDKTGYACINHMITKHVEKTGELSCVFGMKQTIQQDTFGAIKQEYEAYQQALLDMAPLKSELGKQLVLSADAYVVDRESTNGKSILAGFPFFEDWGRDTMIALPGITMVTGRFEECKSILRTFAKYIKNGLLPNLFPEGDENPMYNSVDAPLLFINTVYEYLQISKDEAFAEEMLPGLEEIAKAYQRGTDFHIHMDEDGLIQAGADLEQLTWMDVRVGDHLPTPRHGKPVEINAYWYSALKVLEKLTAQKQAERSKAYADLAEQVKASFLAKFWNKEEDCLKDVLSGNEEENQVRCNQVWVLTQPFTMLDDVHKEKVLRKIRTELYTTIGLRTLSPKDKAFHEVYIGPMEQRDRAYHQGTTWAFPLGAYYRACISLIKQSPENHKDWQQHVQDGMLALEDWLWEGCLGQIAEIYDGLTPTVSRGCYAQAWSVGELLRAVYEYETM